MGEESCLQSNISLPDGSLSRNYAGKVKKLFLSPPVDADVQKAQNRALTG